MHVQTIPAHDQDGADNTCLPLYSMVHDKGSPSRQLVVDAKATPGLRPLYQMAHSLGIRFRELGAQSLIVTRSVDIDLKAMGGHSLGAFKDVTFDYGPGRPVHIVLSREGRNVVLPYSEHDYEKVCSGEGDCLWCGMQASSSCACRIGCGTKDFKGHATACT